MASGSSEPRVLEQRRCLLLAAIGSTAETSPSNPTLKQLLNDGLLVTIKGWLDELLDGEVGGMDLLLHLLTNIIPLPVTKDMVTSSRLGKAVSSVEKHSISIGSANESAIKSRIQQVKERWSASVKALKAAAKRPSPENTTAPAAKKTKREAGSSLSNLLKKVDNTHKSVSSSTETEEEEAARLKEERDASLRDKLAAANAKSKELKLNPDVPKKKKNDSRSIHWADSKGQALAMSEGEAVDTTPTADAVGDTTVKKTRKSRWAERKKKDIEHEKELLLKSRTGDSADDKDDELDMMAMMAIWKTPQALPLDPSNPPVQVNSNELTAQASRTGTTPAVNYASEADVPISPHLLSQVEQALDIVNTAAPNVIPFFTPQAAPPPMAAAVALPQVSAMPSFPPPQAQPVMQAPPTTGEATLETVLMMGLPLFLVGSNVQALQTLQSNPGLLASFKDVNGVYKQPELINLVQTLSQNLAPQAASQPVVQQMPAYNAMQTGYYQPSAPAAASTSMYAQPPPAAAQPMVSSSGYRGDQNASSSNLHLSGYGPMTTNEEIKAMFAPYVHVTEVVNKSGFSFVNTNDPAGAARAKEALNGSLLGGLPCRINNATRKEKNPNYTPGGAIVPTGGVASLPRNAFGQVDYDQAKDDRGNPPTKNLFVAGYGVGTTEQHLRDTVGQYATVLSVVMKGTFAFVNTNDKEKAVIARMSLTGQPLNGGTLRVNFAKETGRLGTSFDSTYGPGGGNPYGR